MYLFQFLCLLIELYYMNRIRIAPVVSVSV